MADQFKLTAQQQLALRNMTPDLRAARETIAKLKQIGVPVDEQEARVERAEQIRAGLLQHFSNPIING